MKENTYLVVRLRLSLYDMVTMPHPIEESVRAWLTNHGIDLTQPFSVKDAEDSLHRIYEQRHMRKDRHDAPSPRAPALAQS